MVRRLIEQKNVQDSRKMLNKKTPYYTIKISLGAQNG